METEHRLVFDDARNGFEPDSCELVVTSPPYPMIEMWDDVFDVMDSTIGDALESGDGQKAFEGMHQVLDKVWKELATIVVDGGIVCVNVGDATRTVDGTFRSYQNHSRIVRGMERAGFETLPGILWRKPANSAAKFMGSGMLPPNAYVTLEHEYVLIFRNGSTRRTFEPGDNDRYEAAYFWEERNRWFSDLWTDIRGVNQALENADSRERTGAYPLAIPYRLISMFSIYGDTILDPFAGTGTTTLAAMITGRNSVCIEIDSSLKDVIHQHLSQAPEVAEEWNQQRIESHREYLQDAIEDDESLPYVAEAYDMPVRTSQEEKIHFYSIAEMVETDEGFRVIHDPL